jgi:hypothetical protein
MQSSSELLLPPQSRLNRSTASKYRIPTSRIYLDIGFDAGFDSGFVAEFAKDAESSSSSTRFSLTGRDPLLFVIFMRYRSIGKSAPLF